MAGVRPPLSKAGRGRVWETFCHLLALATLKGPAQPQTGPTGTSTPLPCSFLLDAPKLALLSLRVLVHALPCARMHTSSEKPSLILQPDQVPPPPPSHPAPSPRPPGYNPGRSAAIYSCRGVMHPCELCERRCRPHLLHAGDAGASPAPGIQCLAPV